MLRFSDLARPLGDPRVWTLPAEALALLESLPPGAALVDAITEVAAAEALQSRSEHAARLAERALELAAKLELSRPARALGFRGMARSDLGDPGGLDDYREAIELATEAGQGREVALLCNNLSYGLLAFAGPKDALEKMREGKAFAQARGLTEMVNTNTASSLDALVLGGSLDEALQVATDLVGRVEGSGDLWDLVPARRTQVQIMVLRGLAAEATNTLDWLETTARGVGVADLVVACLASAAIARTVLGQHERAAALLSEVEETDDARASGFYPVVLPAMVRAAVEVGATQLAELLTAGYVPRTPHAEHALASGNAALSDAGGDIEAAADGYADAADRWERFGVVLEHPFALLGRGRCLIGLSRPSDAAPVLRHAREIFERLEAAPALAETDALLQQATALSS